MDKAKLYEECLKIWNQYDGEAVFYIPKLLEELRKYKTDDLSDMIGSDELFEFDGHWIRIESYGSEVTDMNIDGIGWASEKDADD